MKLSPPILLAASTAWDTGPFAPSSAVRFAVMFYSDIQGSEGARITTVGDGSRTVTVAHIEQLPTRPLAGEPNAYVASDVLVGPTGTASRVMLGAKYEGFVEAAGRVRHLSITSTPLTSPAGSPLSYRYMIEGVDQ